MPTRTSVGTGNWNTAGTWDTGVPADGDTVVIATGHTVTFNADQSAWVTGIAGMTITGTLTFPTGAGTYFLLMAAAAAITGAGTLNVGTSGTPIPFVAKCTITGRAGWYIDGTAGLTMTVYGTEPTNKTIRLSGAEAAGQTVLSVDTNVTGDIWAAGDTIRIDDVNGLDSEERVIAVGGVAAGEITVTAALTGAKIIGALVHLVTRNVQIIAVGAGTDTIRNIIGQKLTIGSGAFIGVTKYMFNVCTGMTVSGGIFTKHSYAIFNTAGVRISGGVWTGNTGVINTSYGLIVSGGMFSGMSYGIGATVHGAQILGGTWSGLNSAINGSYNVTISGATMTGNTNDVYYSTVEADNSVFGDTNENLGYNLLNFRHYSESRNHDQVDGALRAWTMGGVVSSQVVTVPVGYIQAFQHVLGSATWHCYWKKRFVIPRGEQFVVTVQLRKDASMTYLPRVYLMAGLDDPLAGATPVDTFTMTDSAGAWESDTFTIPNLTDYDQEYVLWFVAMNGSGNVYSAYDMSVSGGGAVTITPQHIWEYAARTLSSGVTLAANAVSAASIAADAVTEIQAGLATSAALAVVDSVVDAIYSEMADVNTVIDAMNANPPAVNVTMQAGVLIPGPLALETTAQAILEDTDTTLPAVIAGIGAGSGTGYYTDTVDDGTNPLDGVRVQLYTGAGRSGLAYEAFTNALGVFEMWPDPGVYYRWLDLAGYTGTQGVEVTVVAL